MTGHEPSATRKSGSRAKRAAFTAFVLSAVFLVVGALSDVDRNGASLFGIEGPRCPLGSTFGEDACPGCGLTRSVAFSVQGELSDSFAMHPAGPVITLCLVLAFVLSGSVLLAGRTDPTKNRLALLLQRSFVISLLLGSLLRILRA